MARIALTGGGTGGHIYPCLALAEELEQYSEKLYYIGNSNKLEATLLQNDELKDANGEPYSSWIDFLGIEAEPLPRTINPLRLWSWGQNFIKQSKRSIEYLKEHKIDLVFGTGGYVAAPVFAAASWLKIPYVVHNLDAYIGLANRAFLRGASLVTLAFPVTDLPMLDESKVKLVGNPISKKFRDALALAEAQNSDESSFKLLITGGSQGAQSINEAIGAVLEELVKVETSDGIQIQITHITGSKTYDDYVAKYLSEHKYPNYKVEAYTHDMPQLSAEADLSICRAGAMTIAEMASSSTVPIFLPLTWAAHDHQRKNAQVLEKAGAAFVLDERDYSPEELKIAIMSKIYLLAKERELHQSMKAKLKEFSAMETAAKIAELVSSCEQ